MYRRKTRIINKEHNIIKQVLSQYFFLKNRSEKKNTIFAAIVCYGIKS